MVYSHSAFQGGLRGDNLIIVGGITPSNDFSDDVKVAYSYDCSLGRWNTFTLPHDNLLNRQGSDATLTQLGIWGGKRASPHHTSNTTLPSHMYRLDSIYPSNSTHIISPSIAMPPLRYSHSQTLVGGHFIVILGGFDGSNGDAISMADIWVFDTLSHGWAQVHASLDQEQKPANRSSHSQVLMPDGVYGGYDGYHVFNDVAVLDTRTWTWTVKNTNAAVQGRADVRLSLEDHIRLTPFFSNLTLAHR
ncbi:hypothetical protein DM01DRAFT_250918 [Hesseltinella vesiculosa]|uniref:Galactose oxidase n=1 Tax=Hesseltinella vesiculosa TaxID=101127 RepID=A0A1X2GCM9_9FUNG|nr:hypothetical protein DM01DRAFT_250918 [Hesseltinella vesiculosa]